MLTRTLEKRLRIRTGGMFAEARYFRCSGRALTIRGKTGYALARVHIFGHVVGKDQCGANGAGLWADMSRVIIVAKEVLLCGSLRGQNLLRLQCHNSA